jgi:hypothetical protein
MTLSPASDCVASAAVVDSPRNILEADQASSANTKQAATSAAASPARRGALAYAGGLGGGVWGGPRSPAIVAGGGVGVAVSGPALPDEAKARSTSRCHRSGAPALRSIPLASRARSAGGGSACAAFAAWGIAAFRGRGAMPAAAATAAIGVGIDCSAPHWAQYRAPGGFSLPQLEHFIRRPPEAGRAKIAHARRRRR